MAIPTSYSLSEIAKALGKNWLTIFMFCLLTIAAGVLTRLIIPEKYEAETVFIVKNPLFDDRNNLYSNDTKLVDYFANEDEIDKLVSLAESDLVQNKIIHDMRLDSVYHYDTSQAEDVYKLKKRFNTRLKIYRTENKNVVLAFTDTDPERAATITNLYVSVVENAMKGLYAGTRKCVYLTLTNKVREEDSTIKILTDSLVELRDQYGIYDIISPSRYNIMLSSMKANGHTGYGRGVEQIQNIESVKDELVSERAKHIALASEYSSSIDNKLIQLTQIIKRAKIPVVPKEPGMLTVILVSGLLGLFFGLLYSLLRSSFK